MQSLHDENIRLQTRLEVIEEITGKRVEDFQKQVEISRKSLTELAMK